MIRPLTVGEHFFRECLAEMEKTAKLIMDQVSILDQMVDIIRKCRDSGGKLFFCGVGGGAGNGAHATGDLFKSANIQAICLTDNIPTVTAITNDEGWQEVFVAQLAVWRMCNKDVLFVLSVGGGDAVRNISANIVRAVGFSKAVGASVIGIVGRPNGYTAQNGDAVLVVPTVKSSRMTTHTEGMQAYILHFITEFLRMREAKWESEQAGVK